MKIHILIVALAIGFSCILSASSARASVVTLSCTGVGCPNPLNGDSFLTFSIVQFPVVLTKVFSTQIDFTETFGGGGIFAFGGEEGQFGGGTLNCGGDCISFASLNTPGLQVFHDPFVGLTISFDSSELAPVPEPTGLLLAGSGVLGLAGYFRRATAFSRRHPAA